MARGDWVDAGYSSFSSRSALKSGFFWRYANTLEEAIATNSDTIQVIPYCLMTTTQDAYGLDTLTSYFKYKIGSGSETQISIGTRYDFDYGSVGTLYYLLNGTPASSGHVIGRMSGGTLFSSVNGKTGYGAQFIVPHNTDGTVDDLTINWFFNGSATHGDATRTITITLDDIPRGSYLESISDFLITASFPIVIDKYIETYTDNLVISVGETTIKTYTSIANGDIVSFTSTEQAAIQALMTDASIECLFTLNSYDGATLMRTTVQTANVIDPSIKRAIKILKTATGYKLAINGIVDSTLDDGLQVLGDLFLNGDSLTDTLASLLGIKSFTHSAKSFSLWFNNGFLIQGGESANWSTSTSARVTVTYPIAYTEVPNVVCTPRGTIDGVINPKIYSISATSFVGTLGGSVGTGIEVMWISAGYADPS